MKKQIIPLLFIPFVLPSCQKNLTDLPKSPFDDPYIRIGVKGEYDVNLNRIDTSEYAELKSNVNSVDSYKADSSVTKVVRQEETRDLKYAYFGNEVGQVSLCSMLSRTDIESRYTKDNKNYVTTKETKSSQQNQTANAGIIKTNSTITDYIYDVNYVKPETAAETCYGVRNSVQNNNEDVVVKQTTPEDTPYISGSGAFGLKPFTNIKDHFKSGPARGGDFKFDILRDENSAVYGKCDIDGKERYLIKEGYSLFVPYTTTVGCTYKAVDNYFYEGLLEKYTNITSGEENFRFTSFRFYHELLILSEAYDGLNVPVLYLEKPVVVEYSEVKYEISYESLGNYTNPIPEPTVE